jgi:hypothetical protein
MPDEAFAWMTRIKSVEREYDTARLALDRLDQHTRENPAVLKTDMRLRDVVTCSNALEGTYVLRLFAEFEIALRHYLRFEGLRVPKNAQQLIDKVRDRIQIPNDFAKDVHSVRDYRNFLVHDDATPVPAVPMRDGTRYLSTFLSWLQRYW